MCAAVTVPNLPPMVFQPNKIIDPIGPINKQPGFGVISHRPLRDT